VQCSFSRQAEPRFGRDGVADDRNQSLQAVGWRLTTSAVARQAAYLVLATLGAAMAWLSVRRGRRHPTLVVSAVLAWLVLVPPHSSIHCFLLLLLPLAELLAMAANPSDTVVATLARGTLVFFGAMNVIGGVIVAARPYGPLCWGALAAWFAVMAALARQRRDVRVKPLLLEEPVR
jgi:hypothetical protein